MPSSPIYFSISSLLLPFHVGKSTHRIKKDTRFCFPGLSCTQQAVCARPSQSINFLYVSNSEYRRCLQNGRHFIDTTQCILLTKKSHTVEEDASVEFQLHFIERAHEFTFPLPYCSWWPPMDKMVLQYLSTFVAFFNFLES